MSIRILSNMNPEYKINTILVPLMAYMIYITILTTFLSTPPPHQSSWVPPCPRENTAQ